MDCGGLGRAFVFESGEDSTALLKGLTIINGVSTQGEESGSVAHLRLLRSVGSWRA